MANELAHTRRAAIPRRRPRRTSVRDACGSTVCSQDDQKLGSISGVLVEPTSRRVRYFVVKRGGLLPRRYMLAADIPAVLEANDQTASDPVERRRPRAIRTAAGGALLRRRRHHRDVRSSGRVIRRPRKAVSAACSSSYDSKIFSRPLICITCCERGESCSSFTSPPLRRTLTYFAAMTPTPKLSI